jgi:hypothetical protein
MFYLSTLRCVLRLNFPVLPFSNRSLQTNENAAAEKRVSA